MKNNLFICATHGDEQFSIPVVKKLRKQYDFDWIIGNEKALKQNKRFINCDLNRSAPGNPTSDKYEPRRAAEIVAKAKNYQTTIDIHGTFSKCDAFIILSDPSWENIELAKQFNIPNVLLWPSLRPTGPLTQIIRPGLEIECGPKTSKKVSDKLGLILDQYLAGIKPTIKQNFYIITGQIKGENNPELKDFVRTSKFGDPFYPILTDNRYPGIACYKAERLNDTL